MLVNEYHTIIAGTPHYCIKITTIFNMKVLIIHHCHLHRDFYNSILCHEYSLEYSLTGSVSSSSGVVPLQLLVAMNYSLVHDAMS